MQISKLHQRGFTLVELLVVIAVIGILVSIVFLGLSEARAKSRDKARVSDLKQLELAATLYREQSGNFPDELSDLLPTFMPAIPEDPRTDNPYSYESDGSTYLITATLETGDDGTCFVKSRERAEPSQGIPCDNI